jgi:hypothetical protein
MMKLRFTEYPVYVTREDYDAAIAAMTARLMNTGLVKGVYQVGGINDPGISDVDLFVVFKNDTQWLENPVANLPFPDNYLFSHRLFGTSEKIAEFVERFTFFGRYNLLAGEKSELMIVPFDESEIETLKYQIAMEYMVKAWLAIRCSILQGTVKLRSFLLHAKAVQYDLRFLKHSDAGLEKLIEKILNIRSAWFNKYPDEEELTDLVFQYAAALDRVLNDCLQKIPFYVKSDGELQISRNMKLTDANRPSINIRGPRFLVPSLVPGKYRLKLQNRLTRFEIKVPMEKKNLPEIISKRTEFLKSSFEYNRNHYPAFICTGHGLNIF